MKPDSAGLVAGMASKAAKLKHGMGADDHPVVVIEFDTGYIDLYSSQSLSPSCLVSQPYFFIDLSLAPPTGTISEYSWLTNLLHLPLLLLLMRLIYLCSFFLQEYSCTLTRKLHLSCAQGVETLETLLHCSFVCLFIFFVSHPIYRDVYIGVLFI